MSELIAALQEIADQYPEDDATADAVIRCAAAGIPLDGIMAMAIRERLLAEVARLEEDGDEWSGSGNFPAAWWQG